MKHLLKVFRGYALCPFGLDFNKVHVGENKKGKVCCKYRPTFYYKKNKLILQKILQKYDSEITILLSCKYCVRLSESTMADSGRHFLFKDIVILYKVLSSNLN